MANKPDLFLAVAEGKDMRSDPDLAAAAAEGGENAFAELVRRHQARIRGMARRLTGSSNDGDDIAQATFLQAWQKIGTYQGGTFTAWLCAICFNQFLMARRKQRIEVEFDETAQIIPFDIPIDRSDDRMDLDRALAQLSDAQRVTVVMCVAVGLSHRECAEATGWPLGTVKSHVQRGVANLRKHLENAEVA